MMLDKMTIDATILLQFCGITFGEVHLYTFGKDYDALCANASVWEIYSNKAGDLSDFAPELREIVEKFILDRFSERGLYEDSYHLGQYSINI